CSRCSSSCFIPLHLLNSGFPVLRLRNFDWSNRTMVGVEVWNHSGWSGLVRCLHLYPETEYSLLLFLQFLALLNRSNVENVVNKYRLQVDHVRQKLDGGIQWHVFQSRCYLRPGFIADMIAVQEDIMPVASESSLKASSRGRSSNDMCKKGNDGGPELPPFSVPGVMRVSGLRVFSPGACRKGCGA